MTTDEKLVCAALAIQPFSDAAKAVRSKAQQEAMDQPAADDEVTISLKYHQLRYAEAILDRLAGV